MVTLEIHPSEDSISKPKKPRAAKPGNTGPTSGLPGLMAMNKLVSGSSSIFTVSLGAQLHIVSTDL